mmetsp:Transcript_15434/g.15558  ORF Transcript_15434/g.15558 Transcript_15434/m.15558 type:complete len:301 (+) Transcript_15434:109-1011(+)|eukprot:CAMPEP_0182427912 /NCGR_PEP_ID=MMETSP1167-20130531/20807_1 /TAXON_ID=2988 /ORGANISM="Mallomonas Sp, Strain CCMP3275" /LENGTH=300 /DNA_ID=CAMNT_0024610493 /DNA_START=108 /DNA_END=1010 /DNA_ORIENTATION=+
MVIFHIAIALVCCSLVTGFNSLRPQQSFFRKTVLHSTEVDEVTEKLNEVASKWKLVQYGQRGDDFRLELPDRTFMDERTRVVVTPQGGLGLSLLEAYSLKQQSGLVLIDEIIPGSNAEKGGGFQIGDSIVSIASLGDDIKITTVEGRNFDYTVNELRKFSEYEKIAITVKRPVKRKEIDVKMYGPKGEFAGNFTVLSGYGTNMRTALQSMNMKMYDERMARFDAPYEGGNCGGEGTCGTCQVEVMEGMDLLNKKVRVEDAVLIQQGMPANYRWACRAEIAGGVNRGGTVRIKLRPQTANW